jgi:hypothetical protein
MTTATKTVLVSRDAARRIMGRQMILPEQVVCFGKRLFSPRTVDELSAEKFPRHILEFCQDSYLLLPVLQISILEMIALMPKLFRRPDWKWYRENDFTAVRGAGAGWCLIGKDVIVDSLGLPFDQFAQRKNLMSPGEILPTARYIVFTLLLWAQITGQRLLPQRYAWSCDELSVGGEHVCVGYFDEGLDIVPMADTREQPSYGIVPLRLL